jgi:hypothetical protein
MPDLRRRVVDFLDSRLRRLHVGRPKPTTPAEWRMAFDRIDRALRSATGDRAPILKFRE